MPVEIKRAKIQQIAAGISAMMEVTGCQDTTLILKKHPTSIYFSLGAASIAGFQLTPLPGCCGILVSHDTFVMPSHQGQGIGTAMMKAKICIAQDLGFSRLLATVRSDNGTELHLLRKAGWVRTDEFVNKRTNHPIECWVLDLTRKALVEEAMALESSE